MLLDLSISILACLTIFVFYKNSLKYYKTKYELITPFLTFFQNSKEFANTIFQKIYLFPENDIFDYLTIILNLKKQYDPFYLLFPEKETCIVTGKLKKRINSFIYKKNQTLKHLGLKYVSKHKEKGKYKVFGNKYFLDFIMKYDIDKFYVSYFPKTLVKDCSFKCILHLEIEIKNIEGNLMFYEDFYECLQNMPDCSDEMYKENKARYEKDVGTEQMKYNIKQREAEIIEKRQNTGDDTNKKKKKDKQKVVYNKQKK